jgi:hypothetical protein
MAVPVAQREAIKSALVSAQFTANTLLGFVFLDAFNAGAFTSVTTLSAWIKAHWLPTLGAFLYGGGIASRYRASQAIQRVNNTVTLPGGGTAVLTPPPAQPGKAP